MNSTVNEFLVESLIDHFKKSNLDVKFANFSGFSSPQKIKEFTPDVLAFDPKQSLVHIGLVKNREQLEETETIDQFKEFSRRMMKTGTSEKAQVPFHIAVPKECENMVKEVFEKAAIPWKESIHVLAV